MRYKLLSILLCLVVLLTGILPASALEYASVPEGSYYIQGSLSCFINAMGGVEFGGPMLTGIRVNANGDGSKTMTLLLNKSSVTIYSVTCDTFVDAAPGYVTETDGIVSGTIGWYDTAGELHTDDIRYTISEDTAENAAGEAVPYVDSITFPLEQQQDTYYLTLYINSNVMGSQFTLEGYPATVTVDWSTLSENQLATEPNETVPTQNEPAAGTVEVMDGLNIYRPEAETTPVEQTEVPAGSGIIAYFKVPLLIWTGVIGAAVIAIGVILIVWGNKENKK